MHESLGETLRKTREATGITVEDVSFRAKIPRPVIEALETEDFGFFTSPLYARSFLKQYGEYIGADVEPWLNDLVPSVMVDSDSMESILGVGSESKFDSSEADSTEKSLGGIWGSIWIFLITIALIWAGIKIYEIFDAEHAQTELPAGSEIITPESPPSEVQPRVERESLEPETPKRAKVVEPTD